MTLTEWQAFAQVHGLTDASARPPTNAERIVAHYLAAHADPARANLGPYVEPLFDDDEHSTAALAGRTANGEQPNHRPIGRRQDRVGSIPTARTIA